MWNRPVAVDLTTIHTINRLDLDLSLIACALFVLYLSIFMLFGDKPCKGPSVLLLGLLLTLFVTNVVNK